VRIRPVRLGVEGKGKGPTMVAGVAGCRELAPAEGMEVEVMAHCSGFEGRKVNVGCWR
jgi:hypothetical protein